MMGVSQLWKILEPVREHHSLLRLSNKRLAVDLSGWIVESQSIKNFYGNNVYLRNLFFRLSHLLLLDISPVFILDGEAPALKEKTMVLRRELSSRKYDDLDYNETVLQDKPENLISREKFQKRLTKCKQLLESLGIVVLKSKGEAEALCASLDRRELVDGCITNDNDAFLYGARTVFRNLELKNGGSVDVYCMDNIKNKLGLTIEKMLALAILVGCDYSPGGVRGVGYTTALRWLKMLPSDCNPLIRINSWNSEKYLALESAIFSENPEHCGQCQQFALEGDDGKEICKDCRLSLKFEKDPTKDASTCKCECQTLLNEAEEMSLEMKIRQKAIRSKSFDPSSILNTFAAEKEINDHTELDLIWKKPNLESFVNFMEENLKWKRDFSNSKLFPLITRWQLKHLHQQNQEISDYSPVAIVKTRKKRKVPYFEVKWNSVMKDEHFSKTTMEPKTLFSNAFPVIAEQFEQNFKKRKNSQMRKSSKKCSRLKCK